MQKSESIKNIAAALVLFHMKVEVIKKDATNPHFGKKYASLLAILENIQHPLAESGLTFSQFPIGEGGLVTILMHAASGEFLMGEYTMKPVRNDPQGLGSVITYQRRYALCAVLGLGVDDDDDGNGASGKPGNSGKEKGDKVDEKPWLNEGSNEWKGAVEKMKAGKSSIEALKKFFRISAESVNKLNEQVKASANATAN